MDTVGLPVPPRLGSQPLLAGLTLTAQSSTSGSLFTNQNNIHRADGGKWVTVPLNFTFNGLLKKCTSKLKVHGMRTQFIFRKSSFLKCWVWFWLNLYLNYIFHCHFYWVQSLFWMPQFWLFNTLKQRLQKVFWYSNKKCINVIGLDNVMSSSPNKWCYKSSKINLHLSKYFISSFKAAIHHFVWSEINKSQLLWKNG